jgi:Carbohydrate family 9 binding domain-like
VAGARLTEWRCWCWLFRTVLRLAKPTVGAATLSLLACTGACRPKAISEGDYRVARASPALSAERFSESGWSRAEHIAWGPADQKTAFRALWNDGGLFVRFDVDDAAPWNTKTRHDEKLWEEEVVEIFLQPPGASGGYGEIEISPGNVTCDVWVTPAPRQFDLSWNLDGLESAVTIRQDAAGRPRGWSTVAFLPWAGFARAERGAAPHRGDRWRFNVFRIERPGGAEHPADGVLLLAWSPTGQSTFHVPEAFRGIVFAD